MKKAKKAENPIRKIIGICLILLFVMGVGVMASNAKLYNVKIILSNGYIMNVTTSKTKVSEILDENHIILLPEESVLPNEDSELSDNKTIKISKDEQQTVEVAENAEEYEKTLDTTQKNTCRYCHQRGHKERKCPLLHPELQKVPRMKPKKDVTELEIRDRVGTRENVQDRFEENLIIELNG